MSYSITVINETTNQHELIEGENVNEVLQTVANKMLSIQRQGFYIGTLRKLEIDIKKNLAKKATDEIQIRTEERNKILIDSLDNHLDIWEFIYQDIEKPFNIPAPIPKDLPQEPNYISLPMKPEKNSFKYFVKKGLLDYILNTRYKEKLLASEQLYLNDCQMWESEKDKIEKENEIKKKVYLELLQQIKNDNHNQHLEWLNAESRYLVEQNRQKDYILNMQNLIEHKDKEAIEYYFFNLLKYSKYHHDLINKNYTLVYNPSNQIIAVDYVLPNISDISSIKEVKYNSTKDTFEEKEMSKTEFSKHYENVIYQIVIRIINEIFSHDDYSNIEAVGFNGYLKSIDRATGQDITPCILSIIVKKEDFQKINLRNIEFKSCFKNLKGISASSLATQTAIAPVLTIDKNDKRFILQKDIVDSVDDKVNLASMNWEDFEHFVRELFEKEFSVNGGEVKVTQASRDGGVDAIAFDPDPIRGGKIVIQAKRYTNTVGVSAVRDLYGTVMNEGATKGILVTTSDYGSDAYEFAKGKPITLLNGANLLYLLEKHGHKAKIDLNEARQDIVKK